MKRTFRALTSLVLFVLIWEALGRSGIVSSSLFCPPSKVLAALAEMALSGELLRDVKVSLGRAMAGLFVGSSTGIVIGMLTGRVERLNDFLSPVLELFRPLPPVAIIPLVIVWFGIGEPSKVFSIAFAVFFPVWVNVHTGAKRVPPAFLWSAATLKLGRIRTLLLVIFPSALPFVIAGFRTGIALSFVMVFVSELAGASSGIGYQISVSHLAYRVDRMMAALLVLGIAGSIVDFLSIRLVYAMFPWLKISAEK
jgi:ABC-type nitrate/sulfonate/bicarbonate transport system permease component